MIAPTMKPASGSALARSPRSYPITRNAIAKMAMLRSTRFTAGNFYSVGQLEASGGAAANFFSLEQLQFPGGAAAAPFHTSASDRLAGPGGVRCRGDMGRSTQRPRKRAGLRRFVGGPELSRHVRADLPRVSAP